MEQEKQEVTQDQTAQENATETAGAATEQSPRTEADDYADIKNRTAEVIETTAREVAPQTTYQQPYTGTDTQEQPFEQPETALSVLQETRDLLKKQVKQGTVRMITGIVIAVFIAIAVIFGIYATNIILKYGAHVMEQLDVAMGMVGSIEDLIHQISHEIDALDLDSFNSLLANLDTISGDIAKATTAISDATQGITDAVKQLGDFVNGLQKLNPFR